MAIRKQKFDLVIAGTLLEALRQLTSSEFDVVFTDLGLPDSHGAETFHRVHAVAPQVAIIVLTGSDDDPLGLELVHNGAQDYLVKGKLDSHLLVRATRYAVERRVTAEHTEMLAATLAQKNAEMEKDLLMAREVQQAFLPNEYPTFPKGSDFSKSAIRFCHRYCPAGAVGGDFFDVVALSDWEAGVLICDVMGHGVSAALIAVTIRTLMAGRNPHQKDPGELLSFLNSELRRLLTRVDTFIFASAFYLVANVQTGRIRYANAGHCYPFHLRSHSKKVESLRPLDMQECGPALGIANDVQYVTTGRTLDEGDRILFFTDGLYDVDGPDQKHHSPDEVEQCVTPRFDLPLSQLLDELVDNTRRLAGPGGLADDVCVIGMDVGKQQRRVTPILPISGWSDSPSPRSSPVMAENVPVRPA